LKHEANDREGLVLCIPYRSAKIEPPLVAVTVNKWPRESLGYSVARRIISVAGQVWVQNVDSVLWKRSRCEIFFYPLGWNDLPSVPFAALEIELSKPGSSSGFNTGISLCSIAIAMRA
jgi:hypothetical protein